MIQQSRHKSSLLLRSLCLLGLLSSVSMAREIRAAAGEETKRLQAAAKQHDAEVWAVIEPQIQDWAKKGKPYIPWAANPADLPQAKVPAFPGAEGGGKYSFGGRGGKVYVVTTLADSGPGSFREACEAAGPRIIVFNVAGIIRLQSPISIRAPYITVAGQTAPGDGVCIAGDTVEFDTHDVVIRYMRFRRGENNVERRDDSLGGDVIGNMIVDHVSTSWSMDENLSMYRHIYTPPDGSPFQKLPTVNITIQWTISSESLNPNDHAFGGTWGGKNSSFHHNLFANNTGRNPSIGMGFDFNFVNNVLYNYRHRTVDGGDKTSLLNIINNYYKPGPITPNEEIRHCVVRPMPSWSKKDPVTRWGKVYAAGNVVEGDAKVTADNWSGGVQFKLAPTEGAARVTDEAKISELRQIVQSEKPFEMAAVTTQSAKEAYELVTTQAGATLPHRDLVDTRVLKEVRSGVPTFKEGQGIIVDIAQVGGYPEYKGEPRKDLCPDGIPLSWKTKYKLDVKDAELSTKDLLGDGYTVMDKYLAGLDPTKKIDWTDARSNVNTLTETSFNTL